MQFLYNAVVTRFRLRDVTNMVFVRVYSPLWPLATSARIKAQ